MFRMTVRQIVLFAAVLTFAAVGCGEGGDSDASSSNNGADVEMSDPDAGGSDEEDVPVEPPTPEWTMPALDGVDVLEDTNDDPDIVEVTLTATPVTITLVDDVQVEMLGYNGTVPGPALQAKVGDEVIVHFTNSLAEPTTVHWHGLRISDQMDGSPRIQDPVQPGETFTYRYVVADAGSYWYHPHVRAHEQMERG
jgi:FtsP/CotA-like multicopper oxidase with cupredoxin domain